MSSSADTSNPVAAYYASEGLAERILAALEQDGIDTDRLTPEQLAPVDQFHGRGILATREQAALIDLGPGMRVLDIGCGLGGPARYLAATFGCHVSGIDLTAEFCRTAELLTERCGLGELVDTRCASALEMPFGDAAFDVAWCQNVAMNIEDKAGFNAEVHRVLRPGGKYVFSDVVLGPVGEPVYPVSWAADPSISFLVPMDEARAGIEAAGFRILEWIDTTASRAKAGDSQAQKARMSPQGALGMHLVMGPDFAKRSANGGRNMAEGRTAYITGVVERID